MSARISARYMASSIIDTFCSRFISFLALAAACNPVMPSLKPSLISRPFFTVKPLPGERIIFFIPRKDKGYARLTDTPSSGVPPPDSRGQPPTETGLLAWGGGALSVCAAKIFGVSLAPLAPLRPFAVRRNYCRARSPFAVRRSHAGKPCKAPRRSWPKIEASKGTTGAAIRSPFYPLSNILDAKPLIISTLQLLKKICV